ncbi:MAG: hypothetical protein JRG91_20960 [Deltaproteobacteria bacterium]|nr:hypothetical protein [Deltaproteobacteria bacterium]
MKNTFILLVPLLVACGSYIKTVEPHESATLIEPEDEMCLDKDATAFFESQLESIQDCTESISCKKHPGMTITLMAGCNGTEGGLYVLSHEQLKKFNQCIAEKGESWDYSVLCDSSESECAWSFKLDVVCTEK